MSQSRRMSALEVACSTAFGYVVAVGTQMAVLPWFGVHVTHAENFAIAAVFTCVSLARGYLFRRIFNSMAGRLDGLGW